MYHCLVLTPLIHFAYTNVPATSRSITAAVWARLNTVKTQIITFMFMFETGSLTA
jgi:hypothetical protein